MFCSYNLLFLLTYNFNKNPFFKIPIHSPLKYFLLHGIFFYYSIFLCLLLCIKTSRASLDASQMNSLLSETMREPSATFAARKPFQALDPFTTGRRPAAVDQSMVPRPEVIGRPFTPNFDQSVRFPSFPSPVMPGPEVLGGPLTPSVADISSAINEVKALNLKEAQIDKQLFEQSEQFVHPSKLWSSE